jgi:hypothetical protein
MSVPGVGNFEKKANDAECHPGTAREATFTVEKSTCFARLHWPTQQFLVIAERIASNINCKRSGENLYSHCDALRSARVRKMQEHKLLSVFNASPDHLIFECPDLT